MLRVFMPVLGPPPPPSLVVILQRAQVSNSYRPVREGWRFLGILNREEPAEIFAPPARRGRPRDIFVRSPLTGKKVRLGSVRRLEQYNGSVAVFDPTPQNVLAQHNITMQMAAGVHSDWP